ncbi:MAG: Stk1 family PASTA domain-containing Ser/Thr kinase, partial [Oscillospiraceae bacterium]
LLSHPNIVKVYDVNFSDSVQYIVMEYLDGITLKEYIDRQKPLSWKDTLHFTVQVLKALQHAHDRGIVHRDIKPQNIMLLSDGSIKVMDFGIARFSRSETRTITDKAIGSVHYISPEQAKGDITDAKADIYSLGVMMYEMLTGVLPFESDSPVSVAIKQISDAPVNPREIVESIPEGLEEITLKAMSKDSSQRYQSAAQMLRDIDEFKKNPSISFAYKYVTDDDPTIYIDDSAKAAAGVAAVRGSKKKKKGSTTGKKKLSISTSLLLGITGACVVGALILLFMVFNMGDSSIFSKKNDIDLPNYVEMNISDVEKDSSYSKFHVEIVEDYNTMYGVGIVYDQVPIPPKKVKENSTVTLYVSMGTKIVTVPNVVGKKYGEAVSALQDLGLVVMQESIEDEAFGINEIVKTSPEKGKEVEAGSVITVYVNSPTVSSTTFAPKLVGLDFNTAKTTLTINGLKVGNVTEEDSDQPKGIVLRQSEPEGTKLAQNSSVDLVISKGKVSTPHTITISMPYSANGKASYSAQAKLEGGVIGNTTISAGPTNWTITCEGTTPGVLEIIADGKFLISYTIDFKANTHVLKTDGKSDPAFVWTNPTPVTFSITSSVTAGDGTISASQSVPSGGTATFTIAANAGSKITDVLVDGVSVGAVGTYTFSNVTGNHTISASFATVTP